MKTPAHITVDNRTLCEVPYGYPCNYDSLGEAKRAAKKLKRDYAPATVIAVPGKCPNYDPLPLPQTEKL